MRRILIYQTDFNVGGIQKSLANILNNNLFENSVIDLYVGSNIFYYQIQSQDLLNIYLYDKLPYWNRVLPFEVWNKKRKSNNVHYDLAIDFSSYSNECAIGVIKSDAKKIMWIHNDMKLKYQEDKKYRILFENFKKKFQYYDEFVAVSDGIVEPFKEMSGLKNPKVTVIPNYIDTKEIFAKSNEKCTLCIDHKKYNLVMVGRLCHQKGVDILLNIFNEVIKYRKDIELYIIGDGPDRKSLKKYASSMKLNDFVHFIGNKDNPYSYMSQMDGLVLTSRYEGQGIVLQEARALGLKIFFPKYLEKYNYNLAGSDDLIYEIINANKIERKINKLVKYNNEIKKRLYEISNIL